VSAAAVSPGRLVSISAAQAAGDIARGAISAEDYTRACLDRIAETDDTIRAFAHLDPEHALAQARALDARRMSGAPLGPLHGIPVAVKDIFDTADHPTECGSPLLAGRRPLRDATAVAKLRAAGAVIVGKTVTTEFAYYHPGPTRNPHDPERTPGGSSSGSAAAVAAGMVPLALGSQTNGSVIRPAAFCGVVGVKPSHGLVSRAGVLELSRALDHVGVFARSLEDAALVLDVIAGHDEADPDTRPRAVADFRKTATEPTPLPPLLAFVRTPIWNKADAATREAFEALAARLGDQVAPIDLPERAADAWSAHRAIMSADMAHRIGPLVERAPERASADIRKIIGEGRNVAAVDYLRALELARGLREGFVELFEQRCNAILTPATVGVAPKSLESTGSPIFCSLWTLTGLPAVSMPLLEGEEGMPLGVQLVGAPGDDGRLLRTAAWLQQTLSAKAHGKRRARR
jgi:Asp-tRNA(Asn)/Glu-tRNA(Gln) amidotransferase A subunit family amidase